MTSPEAFLHAHAREIGDGIRRLWWIFVIVMPISGLALWIAIDHSNANQDRQQAQFRQSLEDKFNQALSISSRQTAYSINKSACGFRGFVVPTLKSYEAAAKDPTLSESARKRNDLRIRRAHEFLDSQVTVPPDFDCKTLPKKPPKVPKP